MVQNRGHSSGVITAKQAGSFAASSLTTGLLQSKSCHLNHRPVRNNSVLGNHHNAIADEVEGVIHIFRLADR